jgi:hypothetical protein
VRVNRQKLIDLASREVKKRAKTDHLLSGYLIGSVTSGSPIYGGTADIDIVMIHDGEPPISREFVPLSDEYHLDIAHHSRDLYLQPTELRVDPWLGPSMCEPIFLHDPFHFFERAQAGVRGQFHRPDFVQLRAEAFLENARLLKDELETNWVKNYTQALLEASNALLTYSGFPIAGRRIAILLNSRLREIQMDSFYPRFLGLLGAQGADLTEAEEWVTKWLEVLEAASLYDHRFAPARRKYHHLGFQTLIEENNPHAILWNLLRTWSSALHTLTLAGHQSSYEADWELFLKYLKLDAANRDDRSIELELFLDDVEVIVENKANTYGA